MKKFIYTFMAIFFATVTLLQAQNQNLCAGKAVFQHIVNGNSVSFSGVSGNLHLNNLWSFGDGTTSSAVDPVHIYSAPGTYIVKHVVYNDSVPNCVDSFFKSIIINLFFFMFLIFVCKTCEMLLKS